MTIRKSYFLIISLFIFFLIQTITLPLNPLQIDDASIYAQVVKNCILFNEWLVPLITPGDISSYLDKPPLGIWLLAVIPKIVGITELTIHIPNVIFSFIFLGVLYRFIQKESSKKVAALTVLVASTSITFILFSRTPKLDILTALFTLLSQIYLFRFLKEQDHKKLLGLGFFAALGFLVKSGFGILVPALTLISTIIFHKKSRTVAIRSLINPITYVALLTFLGTITLFIAPQIISLKGLFWEYIQSFIFKSKYNSQYLKLGLHFPILLFLFITTFPWSISTMSALRLHIRHKLTLRQFSMHWIIGNTLFLFLLYNQLDIRSFTILIAPLSYLTSLKLLSQNSHRKRLNILLNWSFTLIFALLLISAILNPIQANGVSLKPMFSTLCWFLFSLLLLSVSQSIPSQKLTVVIFFAIFTSYTLLFLNSRAIASEYNHTLYWAKLINHYKKLGRTLVIYRPPNRRLFMTSDLCYVDFLAGPAGRYIFSTSNITFLLPNKAIILAETRAIKEEPFPASTIITRDRYKSLSLYDKD